MNQQCRNRQLCAQNKERRQTSKNTIRHTKENGRIHVFTRCKQFLSLMIHMQCYSQSRPVKVLQYHFFSIYGRKPLLPIYPLSLLNSYLRGKEHLCFSIFSFMCNVVQIVDCFQWGLCYSIFSFMCMLCRSLFVFSGVCVTQSSVLCVMLCRSLIVFSGVCVTRSLVLCVCCVDRCLSFCPFSFGHCVVCSSSTYRILITHLVSSNSFL